MNDFLKPEVRCGFEIDVKRKKIWSIELDLYRKLVDVCNKHNLKYLAMSGTLLGAVRHQGFIPWDDDMDIALPRADYDKLCEVAEDEFFGDYFFQNNNTDKNYFVGFSRLRYTPSTGIIVNKSEHKYNNGIFIDIYVYDYIPDSNVELDKLERKIRKVRRSIDNYYFLSHSLNKSKWSFLYSMYFRISRLFITREKLLIDYEKLCKSYYGKTQRLGFLCCIEAVRDSYVYIDEIESLLHQPFEKMMIPIPKEFDSILKRQYGNYMEYPPVEDRGQWHEDIVIFDPDVHFIEYYKLHKEKYASVLNEYFGGRK